MREYNDSNRITFTVQLGINKVKTIKCIIKQQNKYRFLYKYLYILMKLETPTKTKNIVSLK